LPCTSKQLSTAAAGRFARMPARVGPDVAHPLVPYRDRLDRLLAMAPVYNFAHYEVLPLAEMEDPLLVLKDAGGG
jgi:hypothetical protein